MREILFRGKQIDNGEWVYGYVLASEWEEGMFIIEKQECNNAIGGGYCDGVVYDVIPETVGQYTGLTDKNGNKIFEGDVVVTNKFGSPNRKYVIVYDDEIATYIGEGKQGCCRYFTTFSGDADAFEVIGNIHDNPELLKGGAE